MRLSFILPVLEFISLPTKNNVTYARRECDLENNIIKLYYNTTSKNISKTQSRGEDITELDGRQCVCSTKEEYCIISNNENKCSVQLNPNDSEETLCYSYVWFESLMSYIYAPLLLSLLILNVLVFKSKIGLDSFNFIFSRCFPCIRRRAVDRILTQELATIREGFELEPDFRDNGIREETVLKLKTKTINKSDSDQFDVDDVICLICMSSPEEGERVGDLSCGHTFHVTCLKEWIKRRNNCPLCNAQVADSHTVVVTQEDNFNDNNVDTRNGTNSSTRRFQRFYRFWS